MPVTHKAPPPPRPSFDSPLRLVVAALLLGLLVFAAYHNSFKGPFIFDDIDSIPQNTSIRQLDTAFSPPDHNGITVSGRPVLNASFALNHALTGREPAGFHAGNLLIHFFAALTLFAIVRRTLRAPVLAGKFDQSATLLAWFIAALWAVHPLQTESVTYIVQRAESLVGLFYLLTLYGFIRYAAQRRWYWFLLTSSACLVGMGTKEIMATAPFVIFFYDRTFVSGSFRAAWRRHGKLHLCLASTLILLAWLVISGRARGGTVGLNETVTWWGYVCTQAVAVPRYLWLSVWPAPLTLDYGTLIETNYAIIIPCGLAVIGALAATIVTLLRRPHIGFISLWFFAILAPSSSIIPVITQTVAEHRMYLPLAALVTAAVLLLHRWLGRFTWVPLVLFIVSFSVVTLNRNKVYADEVTLWQDVVSRYPNNYRAWNNLGTYNLHKAKAPEEARRDLERALELCPNFPEALNNLGQALVKLGQHEDGLSMIRKSIELAPNKTQLLGGYGWALMETGQFAAALPYLEKALIMHPGNATIHYNIANTLMNLGREAEAEPHFLFTLSESPDDRDALNNYGTILRRLGRIDEAILQFEHLLKIDPASSKAHNNLGIALFMQGKTDPGLTHLRESARLDPKNFETRLNLSRALAQTGHIDEAIALCEALVREKPDADLYNNLGALYGQLGQLDQAGEAFQAALRLDPNNAGARENYAKVRAFLDAQPTR